MAVVILTSPNTCGTIGEGEVGGYQERRVLVELADEGGTATGSPIALKVVRYPSSSMTMRSWRRSFSANRPLLPAAFSCSESD